MAPNRRAEVCSSGRWRRARSVGVALCASAWLSLAGGCSLLLDFDLPPELDASPADAGAGDAGASDAGPSQNRLSNTIPKPDNALAAPSANSSEPAQLHPEATAGYCTREAAAAR